MGRLAQPRGGGASIRTAWSAAGSIRLTNPDSVVFAPETAWEAVARMLAGLESYRVGRVHGLCMSGLLMHVVRPDSVVAVRLPGTRAYSPGQRGPLRSPLPSYPPRQRGLCAGDSFAVARMLAGLESHLWGGEPWVAHEWTAHARGLAQFCFFQ